MSNRDICDRVAEKGYGKERIIADSAEPKSNDELRFLGLRIQPAAKGRTVSSTASSISRTTGS